MHSVEVHSNESACEKKTGLGPEQVKNAVIFGIGYDSCFNYLFKILKYLRKCNLFVLGLDFAKDSAPHYS